jgi:tRNA pseudouridine38-40 synthase
MVRRLIGVLVAVGKGELEPSAVAALLGTRSELPARLTAPASGLFLERVFYKGEKREIELKAATPVR